MLNFGGVSPIKNGDMLVFHWKVSHLTSQPRNFRGVTSKRWTEGIGGWDRPMVFKPTTGDSPMWNSMEWDVYMWTCCTESYGSLLRKRLFGLVEFLHMRHIYIMIKLITVGSTSKNGQSCRINIFFQNKLTSTVKKTSKTLQWRSFGMVHEWYDLKLWIYVKIISTWICPSRFWDANQGFKFSHYYNLFFTHPPQGPSPMGPGEASKSIPDFRKNEAQGRLGKWYKARWTPMIVVLNGGWLWDPYKYRS